MNNYCDEIVENLFVGSSETLNNKFDFDMIVNCTPTVNFPSYCNNCIRIPIKDDPYDSEKFLDLIDSTNVLEKMFFQINNKKNVLVHCSLGIQRSCALVACYLIKYFNMKPIDAIELIKLKRPIAFFGNVNFLLTIVNFYNKIIL